MQRTANIWKRAIHFLPVFGCISTGLIYAGIGVIAILSFLKLKKGGADETRMLAFLNEFTTGRILIFVILAGTASYIIWRFYETIKDPYEYGRNFSGIAKRTGVALSTVADMLIAYAALRFMIGLGNIKEGQQLSTQREMIGSILQKEDGQLIIVSVGAIVLVTAFVQLFYGLTKGYRERLDIEEFSPAMKKIVQYLGYAGFCSRAVIIGITGYFYLKAGITINAEFVVDTDKAFDFIGDNIGHAPFILVAIGTICYGLFMFALAKAYDTDKD